MFVTSQVMSTSLLRKAVACSCLAFVCHALAECGAGADAQRTAHTAPVLLTLSQQLLRKSAVLVNKPEDDITKNLADSIDREASNIAKSLGGEQKVYQPPDKVMGVAFNGPDDFRMLRSALMIGVGGVVMLLVVFCIQRKLSPVVYIKQDLLEKEAFQDTAESPEALSTLRETPESFADQHATFTDWVRKVWNTTPDDELAAGGLDGWAFLEFRRLNCRILGIIGPTLCTVLLPLHYMAHRDSEQTLGMLSYFDIGSDPLPMWMVWVHAALVWFVTGVSAWHIAGAQLHFTERRHQWLAEIPFPRAATVLVQNIPHMYRTDSALKNYFVNVFSEEVVDRAYVVRRTGRLSNQVAALKQARQEVSDAQKCWEAAGSPDEQQYLRTELKACQARAVTLSREVAQAQERTKEAVDRGDPMACSSSGFVTFTSEISRRLASREQYTRDVTEFKMTIPPDPCDVMWKNLADDDLNQVTWNWVGVIAMLGVFIFWVPFVVVISSWTTFGALQEMLPQLKHFVQQHPWVDQLLSGVFATMVLKVFLAFLPTTMYCIVCSLMSVKSGAEVQIQMQQWYGGFLIVFVLLVTTLGRGLTLTLVVVAQQPGKIFSLLANYLPTASHFYFNYEILGWIVPCTELLRTASFMKFHFFRRFCSMSEKEAKEHSEPEDPASYGLGARMASSVLTSSIAFVFCSCSPLVLVFSFVSFALGQLSYKYLIVFAESKKPDTGGLLWVSGVNQLFMVLTVYVLMMTGVLHMLSPGRQWLRLGPPLVALSSLLALYWSKVRVESLAFDTLPLEEVVRASRARKEESKQMTSQYLQRECDPGILEINPRS